MKSKINFPCIGMMLLCLSVSKNIIAQQPQAKPADQATAQMRDGQPVTGYTYKVFQAPNKMFGYDILQNSKGVFHQPAAILPPNNVGANPLSVQQNLPAANDQRAVSTGFSQREFAENAALFSIDKIKKRSSPVLTSDEIKQVIVNKISVSNQKN